MIYPGLRGPQKFKSYGAVTTIGTTVTAGNAGAKGTPVEFSSALDFDAGGLIISVHPANVVSRNYLLDVLRGAATEDVIVPDLFISTDPTISSMAHVFHCPIHVARGERIALQSASGTNGATISAMITAYGGGEHPGYEKCVAFGAGGAGNGRGTTLDANTTTADTEGAWTEFSSAVPFDIEEIMIAVGGANDAARTDLYWAMDIGIGAAAAEEPLIENIPFAADAAVDAPFPRVVGPYPCHVAYGERLALRLMSSSNVAGDRAMDVVVYGFGG